VSMFNLPKSTVVNRIIPKNAFDEYTNTKQKKAFASKVERIRWVNKLSPDTTNLSGTDVKEIQVFQIELKQKDAIPDLLKIIDKSVPYHILFILLFENEALLSASEKHEHPTNEDLAVIDWTFSTDWFEIENNPYRFNLKKNLDYVFADLIFQISGKTPTAELNTAELISKEQKIKQLTTRIEKLKTEIKKCRQFNRKVELNLKLNKYNSYLNDLIN
jgi:hypothetical protein